MTTEWVWLYMEKCNPTRSDFTSNDFLHVTAAIILLAVRLHAEISKMEVNLFSHFEKTII